MMTLRLIQEQDLEIVRELRNANRSLFFNSEVISAEEQRRWYAGLPARRLRFFVIEENSRVVGTISVTSSGTTREIGNIIIDRAYRGHGLMQRAIEELTAEPGDYICRVQPDNEASLGVFRRSGFVAEYVQLSKRTRST